MKSRFSKINSNNEKKEFEKYWWLASISWYHVEIQFEWWNVSEN